MIGERAVVSEAGIMATVMCPANQTTRTSPEPVASHGPPVLWRSWTGGGPAERETGNLSTRRTGEGQILPHYRGLIVIKMSQ